MNLAVLMTCHNRQASTLLCLDSLLAATNQVKVKVEGQAWTIDVFLVDDGSTDGTGEAVQEWFRDNSPLSTSAFSLHLICGSGRDYWAKGMSRAWQAALDYEKDFAFYLWLNDDTILFPDALKCLVDNEDSSVVLVGELVNAKGEVVYGKRGDLFTGNFVLVPCAVYEKVGMICGVFRHAWADSDYAMRCKRTGVPIVSCGVVGMCEGHPNRPSLAGLPLRARWKMLREPKGWCVHDLWLYRRRNWGFAAAVVSCTHLILHVVLFNAEAQRYGAC